MKLRHLCCVVVAVCLILPASPVSAATGSTDVSGTVPLVTYEVSASRIGYFSATISWKTNAAATSQVFYDTKSHEDIAGYRFKTSEDITPVSEHSVTIIRLRPRTKYYFRVRSAILGTDFVDISEEHEFTTLSPPVVVVPPVPPAPPPVPPGPPPVVPPVLESMAASWIFIKQVIIDILSAAGNFVATNLSPSVRSIRGTNASAADN